MPLLDGKYEILRGEHTGERQTFFEASAPDGTLLEIVWCEVDAGQERSFEQYRRALRALRKGGHAALHDVVARPGAHYTAWRPAQGSRVTTPDPALVEALREVGFEPAQADIFRSGRQQLIHGLLWPDAGTPQREPAAAAVAGRRPRKRKRTAQSSQASANNTVASFILLLAAAVLLIAYQQRSNAAEVRVADVTGQQVGDAVGQLARSGLKPEPVAASSDAAPGTVLELAPGPGTSLDRGSSVQVLYAFPQDEIRPLRVPEVTGAGWPEGVREALAASGLESGSIARLHDAAPAGTVIAQSEAAGSTVPAGTPLHLLVSAGPAPETAVLPDVRDLPLREARAALLAAGFTEEQLDVTEVADPGVRPGTVVRTEPGSGTAVPVGTARIGIEAARGDPDTEPLGSFLGLDATEARSRASAWKLDIREISDSARPEGVVAQEPEPGSWLPDGETLKLTINSQPRTIPAPAADVTIRGGEERGLAYNWYIEPGIPEVTARVWATSLEGQEQLVAQKQVRGGESVAGTFDTREPFVTFRLTLNGDPDGEAQHGR